jgi:hypothetical protein
VDISCSLGFGMFVDDAKRRRILIINLLSTDCEGAIHQLEEILDME